MKTKHTLIRMRTALNHVRQSLLLKRGKQIASLSLIGAVMLCVAVWRAEQVSAHLDIVPATFVFQGPAGITGSISGPEISGSEFAPLAGAVNTLALDPTNADIAWIGSANGGIWKTTNLKSNSPTWVPLTDHQASLSISSLSLDPTTGNQHVLVAGIGNFSPLSKVGGPLTGILRTTNGGTTWTSLGAGSLSGERVVGVAARGIFIVVAVVGNTTSRGIWRSADTGVSFQPVPDSAGVPQGKVLELASDPSNSHRLYAGITGTDGDLFRSDNDGENWKRLSGPPSSSVKKSENIEISVHAGAVNAVYAAIEDVDTQQLAGLFRSTDLGQTWTALDVPNVNPGAQGFADLSLAADPADANVVFVAGDHEPNSEGGGQVFRCDASLHKDQQCVRIVREGTKTSPPSPPEGTAPHPDSRDMAFDALGQLVEADDGGVFLLSDPYNHTSDWLSKRQPGDYGNSHLRLRSRFRHHPLWLAGQRQPPATIARRTRVAVSGTIRRQHRLDRR